MSSDAGQWDDARPEVDRILAQAVGRRASDIHLEPTAEGYELRYRIDGLLETVQRYDAAAGRGIVNCLMVMGQILTYRIDVPQEGRVRAVVGKQVLDLRLAVIPSLHGMRAVLRLPAELIQPRTLEELGLPQRVMDGLRAYAQADAAGMLILTGPAGSGKTTTIYALLSKIVQLSPALSVIALEDPVERAIAGVTQIEVSPFGQLTYERALRSILRQDPQVLMLGEIRDSATASLAVQAALSGHRLICTLHAGTPAGAIARLVEMGLEPHQVSSALWGVVNQRLLRRRCGDGYQGRVPAAEIVVVDDALRQVILGRGDVAELQRAYAHGQYQSLAQSAEALVKQGTTDENEARRVGLLV